MAKLYENLRQLITVIDELRDVGLQNYISLPRIAAIGTQSSGKSSAIETVVGIDFLPRGGGVVTRRPLELRLVHLNSTDYAEDTAWAVFDQKPDEKLKDFEEVRSIIQRMTDEVAGGNKGIVNDPILLTIYSTSCPDLTVIDLPGITRVPVKGSDQVEDIEKLTRDMTMHYVKDPRTIILAVLPANQDMSTSDSLQMARQVDPKGHRTIGVITKIDIMDQGTDAVKMLRGEDIPLRLGYVGVKMRSQQDIMSNKPIKMALQDEKDYFDNHRLYSKMPPGMVGTTVLIDKLTQVLLTQIRRFLPEIKREIADKRTKVEGRMDELGHGVPLEDAERRQLMWTMITDYSDMFKNTIRGSYDRKLQRYLTSGTSGVEGGGSRVRGIMNEFLVEYMEHSITSDMQDDDIERAIRMHEGDSLPGFPSPDTFEFLALPHLQKIISPSVECVNSVSGALDHMAQRIATVVLRRFPALAQVTLEMTQNIIQRERDATRVIVEQQVQCHCGYLFTNDNEYLTNHGSMEQMYKATGKQEVPKEEEEPKEPGRMEKTAQQVKEGARAGYDSTKKFMQGPQVPERRQARYSGPFVNEIRHRLDSYFDVMIRNVRDLVPKAIGFYLVRAVVDKLQFELLNSLNDDGKISELLGEPPHILEERKQLKGQSVILQKAHGVLTRDPTLAAIAFSAEDEEEEAPSPSAGGRGGAAGRASLGSAAAAGASSLLSKATGGLQSAGSAAAVAATNASAAMRQQASAAAAAAAPAMQQSAQAAMTSAASNPAVQKQAANAAAAAMQNPAVRQGATQAATQMLLGNKANPLGAKKGLFEDN